MLRHIQARVNEDKFRQIDIARATLGLTMEQLIIKAIDYFVAAHSEEIQALAQTTQGDVK